MTEIKPLKEIGNEYVMQVLRATGGDLAQASRILGVTVAALRRRIKEHGLQPKGGESRGTESQKERPRPDESG